MILVCVLGFLAQINAIDQSTIVSNPLKTLQQQKLTFVSPSYRTEATKLLIVEANQVARELQLPEKLPITATNLVASYISPPRLSSRVIGFGNITTSNYIYYATVGNKFSFLECTGLAEEEQRLTAQFLWPTDRLDKVAAYQLATQLLVAVSMDVISLSKECSVRIEPVVPEQGNGRFVPIYWIYWLKPGVVGSRAEIELFLPTKRLLQMHVMESRYILRKPLEVTNVNFLNPQTNAPP